MICTRFHAVAEGGGAIVVPASSPALRASLPYPRPRTRGRQGEGGSPIVTAHPLLEATALTLRPLRFANPTLIHLFNNAPDSPRHIRDDRIQPQRNHPPNILFLIDRPRPDANARLPHPLDHTFIQHFVARMNHRPAPLNCALQFLSPLDQ